MATVQLHDVLILQGHTFGFSLESNHVTRANHATFKMIRL